MIFACLGAEGTGKTTLVDQMRNLGYYGTDGVSRPCIRAKLHRLMEPIEYQNFINDLTMHHHYPFTKINQVAFFTRSILDCIAYGRVHGLGDVGDWEQKAKDWFNRHRDQYTILYFPIEFELQPDAEREADVEHQKLVDQECRKVLKELNIDHYIITGSLEERVKLVQEIMERIK